MVVNKQKTNDRKEVTAGGFSPMCIKHIPSSKHAFFTTSPNITNNQQDYGCTWKCHEDRNILKVNG